MRWLMAVVLFALLASAAIASPIGDADSGRFERPTRPFDRDLGPAPAGAPIDFGVVVRYRHVDELQRLVLLQGDKTSFYYHRYLNNAQWNAYFAPLTTATLAVVASLQRAGLAVRDVSPNGDFVRARGSVAAASRWAGAPIHLYLTPRAGVRRAPASVPRASPDVRPFVFSVVGLDERAIARYHARGDVAGRLSPRPSAATPTPKPITTATPLPNPSPAPTLHGPVKTSGGGYTPFAIAQAYDYPVQHGYDGRTRSVANVISGDFSEADLGAFLTEMGETRRGPATRRVLLDGGPLPNPGPIPGIDLNAAPLEATLDAEAIVGLAPGVWYWEYLIPYPTPYEIEVAYDRAVSDNAVDVVNSSFGLCEADDPSFEYVTDYLALQGAAKGMTFVAATGDAGSNGCGVIAPPAPGQFSGPQSPAVDTHFTAVGGTSLVVDMTTGAYVSEAGWNGSGGNASFFEPVQPWQSVVGGLTGTTRNTPDVALDADQNTGGYDILFSGADATVGGTSLSSPLFCALQAEIDQIQASRNGWVTPRLYAIVHRNGYVQFRDVTTGSNGLFTAKAGYDNVTGIGSPIGWRLAGTE